MGNKSKGSLRKLEDFDIEDLHPLEKHRNRKLQEKLGYLINRNMFEIKKEEIEIISFDEELSKILGVKYFRSKWRGINVATLVFDSEKLFSFTKEFSDFEYNVNIFTSMTHPAVTQFFGCFCESYTELGIVGEVYDMNLRMFFDERKGNVTVEEKLKILVWILSGFTYFSSRNMILPNFGTKDIMVNRNNITKPGIDTLSLCLRLGERNPNTRNLILHETYEKYQAPELKRGCRGGSKESLDGRKVFVYLFGIILLEVMTEKFEDKFRTKFTPTEKRFAESISLKWLCDIQELCCAEDPEKRIEGLGCVLDDFIEMSKKTKEFTFSDDGEHDYSKICFVGSHGVDIDEKERIEDLVTIRIDFFSIRFFHIKFWGSKYQDGGEKCKNLKIPFFLVL